MPGQLCANDESVKPVPSEALAKANTRPADPKPVQPDPFDGASVEKMIGQCVTLDTESGLIVIEMDIVTGNEC